MHLHKSCFYTVKMIDVLQGLKEGLKILRVNVWQGVAEAKIFFK